MAWKWKPNTQAEENGYPVYMAFCHRYTQYLEGLTSLTITKSLYPEVENLSFDGASYSEGTSGVCTLRFVNDLSSRILVGDIIYIIRAFPTGGQSNVEKLARMIKNFRWRNLVDIRGTVVFQGFVTAEGWSQTTNISDWNSFKQIYEITVKDLTALFTDSNMFGRRVMEGKKSPALHFPEFLKKEYKIDIRRPYQRQDLVDRLVNNYINGQRVRTKGGPLSGSLIQKVLFEGSSQHLGIQFDGAYGAIDWVHPENIFSGHNPSVSIWTYLNRLAPSPLYECFVREDNGLLVFRRSMWRTIGNSPEKWINFVSGGGYNNSQVFANLGNQLLKQRGGSWYWPIPADMITHSNLMKTSAGLSNIVMLARDGDIQLRNSRLADSYLERWGIRFSGGSPSVYNPELTFRMNNYTEAAKDVVAAAGAVVGGVTGIIGNGLGSISRGINNASGDFENAGRNILDKKYFKPIHVQDEILRQSVADVFRGTISLRMWMPISVGDHVKIASSAEYSALFDPISKWNVGLTGKSARTDDFIYYVTQKSLHAEMSENGLFSENMQLRLNYGGLEFIDPLSPARLNILNK